MWGNQFKTTFSDLAEYEEKMKNNELTLEDILDNNDIVQDLKTNSNSEFFPFLTNEIMKKLIDYTTKIPKEDNQKIGYKFPFNASEILCSNNMNILNKFFESKKEKKKNINPDDDDLVNLNNIDVNIPEKKNEGNEEILIYLFDFLNSESSEINYVLIGYFNKIVYNILQNSSKELLNFLFNKHNELFDGLLKHLNRRAIGQLIKHFLIYNEDDVINLNEKRNILTEKIIEELNQTNEEEKYFCICETLIDCLSNQNFFNSLMLNQKLVDLLFSIIYKNLDNERNLKCLLNLMIKINEKILNCFDKIITPNLNLENDLFVSYDTNENNYNEKLLTSILTFLFKSIIESNLMFLEDLHQITNTEIETTYQKNQKKLGMKKLILVEFLRSIIDILVNTYSKNLLTNEICKIIKLMDENRIFWTLHNLFFEYEFNNIYQTLYLQLMEIILNKNSPEDLVNSAFIDKSNEKNNLIPKLIEHTINNVKFEYISERKANSCFFAFEVKLLNEINNSQNPYIIKIIEKEKDFKIFYEIFVERLYKFFTQKLLYNEFNQFLESSNIILSNESIDQIINESIEIYNIYKEGGNYKERLEEIIKREKELKERHEKNQLSISQELINDDNENNDINVFGYDDDDYNHTKGLIDDSPKNNEGKKMELENGFIEDDDFKVVDNINDKVQDFNLLIDDDDEDYNHNIRIKLFNKNIQIHDEKEDSEEEENEAFDNNEIYKDRRNDIYNWNNYKNLKILNNAFKDLDILE